MRKILLAAGAVALTVGLWPAASGAESHPETWLGPAMGVGTAGGVRTDAEPMDSSRERPDPADSRAAVDEATDRLRDASADALVACGGEGGVEVCLRRLRTGSTDEDVVEPTVGRLAAEGPQTVSLDPAPVCTNEGSGAFRVQPVLAHTAAEAPGPSVEEIATALGNVDHAIATSAARTGGSRNIRWATDTDLPDCRVELITTQITTGADSFVALMEELEGQGVVSVLGESLTKFIVFTDGLIEPGLPDTCGLGEAFGDDSRWSRDVFNLNELGARSAVDPRCWDMDNGFSVPAHEILHTLGAVQESAPHHLNDGHCSDEYDLLCYGPTGTLTYPCPSFSDQQLLDCNGDDYFNTDPIAGQYLCNHWNTADSPYLVGGPGFEGYKPQAPRAVTSMSSSVKGLDAVVTWGDTASCYGSEGFQVSIPGIGTIETGSLGVEFGGPAGNYTVTVRPIGAGRSLGASRSTVVTLANPVVPAAPNRPPVGEMVLSLTDGRGYGMLGYAIDPETGGPARMRVTIEGVVNREYDWNYTWADMPRFTGLPNTQAFVFLAQLPPGDHTVCLDALDPQGGGWTRLECHNHTVK